MRARSRGALVYRNLHCPTKTRYVYNWPWMGVDFWHNENSNDNTISVAQDDSEEIVDVAQGLNRFNPVAHVKRYNLQFPACSAVKDRGHAEPNVGWGGGAFEYASVQFEGGAVSPLHMDPNISLPPRSYPSIDWSTLVDEVGSYLDGHMRTSSNLLVSLTQIGQTIGMLKNPMNLKNLKRMSWRKKPLSTISKSGASAWLEYQYGWRNLAADIRALALVYQEADRHAEFLRKTRAKFVGMSHSQTDVCPLTLSVGNSGYSAGNATLSAIFTKSERKAVFSLDVKRRESDRVWSQTDLVMQRLGTTQVVEALWDLVPFSFVVDWFLHVDDWIRLNPAMWNSFDLRNVGYSVKETISAKPCVRVRAGVPGDYADNAVEGSESIVYKSYTRTEGFPPSTQGVGLFGALSYSQLLDGVSLVVQRL